MERRFSRVRGYLIKTLFDYTSGAHSLNDFLDDFPSVTQEQAEEALTLAHRLLMSSVGYQEEDEDAAAV